MPDPAKFFLELFPLSPTGYDALKQRYTAATLDENAHKHAYGVSEDLKYALRECIELLGDEAARQLEAGARAHSKSIYTSGDYALEPGELSLECLRYMYRLLFLFYIEARPELGYAPVDSEIYLKGYALEHLRELELIPLTSEAERQGRYLHDTLNLLFRGCPTIYRGGIAHRAELSYCFIRKY